MAAPDDVPVAAGRCARPGLEHQPLSLLTGSPDGTHAYITHWAPPGTDKLVPNTVSVISTATSHVTATVGVGSHPYGVAVSPSGAHAYVTNVSAGTVSVIDTATNAATATIAVGSPPNSVAVSPGGTSV